MSPPWMPLNIGDYRKDTTRLAAAEHGAYLLLIMEYWHAGSLPDDDRQLARIACMTDREWKRARPLIERFFHADWRHKRIDKELARAAEITGKRRASAEQMHAKRLANAPANAPANAGADAPYTRASPSTQEQKGSEANASGGEPPPETARERLWRVGRPALLALGLPTKQLGSMIGRWLNDCGNDHDRVLSAINRGRDMPPADAIPWITAALAKERPNARKTNGQSIFDAAREQHERTVLAGLRDAADDDAPRLLSAGRGG